MYGTGSNAYHKHDLKTPALLVNLALMEENLRHMAHYFSVRKSKLRPHFKNHRVLELAARQMEAGAIGITCANLLQAEKLVSSGTRTVLIANEIVSEQSLRRFVQLSQEAPVMLAVDNATVVSDLARLAGSNESKINLLVDVDLGLRRCGIAPGEPALQIARQVAQLGMRLRGIMGYEGHLMALTPGPQKDLIVSQAMQDMIRTKAAIEGKGIPVEIVSCGGTGDYGVSGAFPGVTEIQAGAYLLMDDWYAPFATDFKPSLTVLATVISKTPTERIVVDAGVKAISGERGLPSVHCVHGLRLQALHAEHAIIELVDKGAQVNVGDKIELSVQYHDGTIHLHRHLYGIRDGNVEKIFHIE